MISNGTADTATITGPSNLVIDPAVVGDNTGSVRIKGDLFVDGTTTQINSTTLEIADFVVGIASTATTDLLTDGAGIQIGPDNTFLYEHNGGTNPSLKSSENLNVAAGKGYQVNQVEVLNATTLGSGVTASSLRSVGTLNGLTVDGDVSFGSTATFGDDDKLKFGDDQDLEIYHDGTNSYIIEGGTGALRVGSSRFQVKNPGDSKLSIDAFPAGEVALYYDNSKKFETVGYGVTITGDLKVSRDAEVVGILTVGGSSVTIDGNNDTVQVGYYHLVIQ